MQQNDLDWVSQSPPLITELSPFINDPRGLLPAPLKRPNHVTETAPPKRLGTYYEQLWQQLISTQPIDYLANITVSNTQRTLGEFDLLYRTRGGQTVHRELCIKFYLLAPTCNGHAPWHWVGINTNDRLDLKLFKLLSQQLRLSERTEAQAQLQQLGWQLPATEALMQGRIFLPWQETQTQPQGLNPKAPQGVWLTPSALGMFLQTDPGGHWFQLKKHQWLCGPGQPISHKQLLANPVPGQYRIERPAASDQYLMLVCDNWFDQAKKSWQQHPRVDWPALRHLEL